MRGETTPTTQSHKEYHLALVLEHGTGTTLPRQVVNRFIMEATGVGLRQSVNRHLEAWEDLGLIEPETWKSLRGKPGQVRLLASPLALPTEQEPEAAPIAR